MTLAARTSNRPAPGVWDRKLRPQLAPHVDPDPRRGDRLLVPTPMLVAESVARVPAGRVITMTELRSALARQFGADRCCPLTTGMFAAIVAGAVGEDLQRGRQPRWPIWRLVRDDGTLPANWVLDARWRATRLRGEGNTVTRAGEGWRVIAEAR